MKKLDNNLYNNAYYEEIHISEVKPEMTIFHNKELKTVCKNDIKRDKFFGRTLFGDSYFLGTKPVIRVFFKVETFSGTVYR